MYANIYCNGHIYMEGIRGSESEIRKIAEEEIVENRHAEIRVWQLKDSGLEAFDSGGEYYYDDNWHSETYTLKNPACNF